MATKIPETDPIYEEKKANLYHCHLCLLIIKAQNFKFSADVLIMAAIFVDIVTNQEYDWAKLEFPEVGIRE